MITDTKTLADFSQGGEFPCGVDQTKIVDGKRVYPQAREYRNLAELGLKDKADSRAPIQSGRDDR